MRRPAHKHLVVMVLLAAAFSPGCVHVPPYQRTKLAHPTMKKGLEGRAAEHAIAVQEGATGGSGLAGSGCGCN